LAGGVYVVRDLCIVYFMRQIQCGYDYYFFVHAGDIDHREWLHLPVMVSDLAAEGKRFMEEGEERSTLNKGQRREKAKVGSTKGTAHSRD